jgi:hypothetical protein
MIFFCDLLWFLKRFYGVIWLILESSSGDIDCFIGWGLCSPPPIGWGDIDFSLHQQSLWYEDGEDQTETKTIYVASSYRL